MNQINAIYVLFELYDNYEDLVAKQKEEIENLKQYIMPDTMMVLGRPLVIAHIYKKMCEAENMGIVMKTQFSCSLKDINIPDIYLIEIIGNLIDNAMEETISRKLNENIFVSISTDIEEAIKHYKEAIELGNSDAMYNYASMLEREAIELFKKSAAEKNEKAIKKLQELNLNE